jgi:hypothetical protein
MEHALLEPDAPDCRAIVESCIAYLIDHDFNRLIQLLYRIDVDESLLRRKLKEFPEVPAYLLITDLILERNLARQEFKRHHRPDEDIPAEDRW